MHPNDAVLDLAATAQPLPRSADRVLTALGRPRFINAADRFGVVVFAGHQLLALVAHRLLLPLD